ncbi:MAG: HAD-IIIA family hydrolase, partial [Pseudobdellovibrionaceae bacterium]
VVTNQPDVARGTTTKDSIDRIHDHLKSELPLDTILTCFHDDADKCDCRKPKPGLIFQAAKEMSIDLSASFMVGDRWRDIEAGQKAGCQNFFVDYGYDEKQPQSYDFRVSSLLEASQIILQKDKS